MTGNSEVGARKVRVTGKVRTGQCYSLRRNSSHASAPQIVSNATVDRHGPQRIGIKTKIRNNSYHPAERFCERDGAASVVFSEDSTVSSRFLLHILSLVVRWKCPQLPRRAARHIRYCLLFRYLRCAHHAVHGRLGCQLQFACNICVRRREPITFRLL
jgi:hypothetical protein